MGCARICHQGEVVVQLVRVSATCTIRRSEEVRFAQDFSAGGRWIHLSVPLRVGTDAERSQPGLSDEATCRSSRFVGRPFCELGPAVADIVLGVVG